MHSMSNRMTSGVIAGPFHVACGVRRCLPKSKWLDEAAPFPQRQSDSHEPRACPGATTGTCSDPILMVCSRRCTTTFCCVLSVLEEKRPLKVVHSHALLTSYPSYLVAPHVLCGNSPRFLGVAYTGTVPHSRCAPPLQCCQCCHHPQGGTIGCAQ